MGLTETERAARDADTHFQTVEDTAVAALENLDDNRHADRHEAVAVDLAALGPGDHPVAAVDRWAASTQTASKRVVPKLGSVFLVCFSFGTFNIPSSSCATVAQMIDFVDAILMHEAQIYWPDYTTDNFPRCDVNRSKNSQKLSRVG